MEAKKEIIKLLKKAKVKNIELEIPSNPEFGDYALPCFIVKEFKKNPVETALFLAEKIRPSGLIKEIKAAGPFLNFKLNKQVLASIIIPSIVSKKEKYGRADVKKEKTMVEFSQPNTHKGFHIGHLRNVCIGDALVKIMRLNGYPVVAANYINDTGAHVAKCLWYYLKYNKKPSKNKGEWLGKIYSSAVNKIAENPDLREEVNKIHEKIEKHDKEIENIWNKTRKWSLDDFNRIYDELNVNFDAWFYDSKLIKPGKEIVKKLLKKKTAEESEGAIIVELKKYKLPTALILKSDGTALYLTKDLALAEEKFEKYRIEKSIYVVGSEQKLHFQQLFKILELYGFKQAKKCRHVSYELVMLKQGRMSSRAGNVVLFSELNKKIRDKLKKEVDKRHPDWNKKLKEKAVDDLALSAMKFGMLKYENNKVIIFDLDKALDFEGETGPYVQYAHARICSILRKYKKEVSFKKVNYSLLDSKEEENVISLLAKFEDIISEAASSYKPYLVCRYILDLAQAFNEFYHACPILQADETEKKARLMLILGVKQILSNGLGLLGISAPERM